MNARHITLFAACLLLACPSTSEPDPDPTPTPAPPRVWTEATAEDGPVRAASLGEIEVVAPDAGGLIIDGAAVPGPSGGTITWVWGDEALILAHVHGGGLVRSTDGGASFQAPSEPPALPAALGSLLNPRGTPVPFGASRADDGRLWLATIGGLFRSDDDGDTWSSTPVGTSGSLNVLFTDVVTDEDHVWAVSQLADSMLPASFSGLLAGTVFHSPDRGTTWVEVSEGLGAVAPTSVVIHNEFPCVGSMDGGVSCLDGFAWGTRDGPLDVVALAVSPEGELLAGTASDGLLIRRDGAWVSAGSGPIVAVGAESALGRDGSRYALAAGEPAPRPERSGGTVHVALSFHVNLYHSYRGDTNDDDGYGQDLRVLRRILEWLEDYPDAKADWDIENHFSLDGWLATDGADIVTAIAERVDDGRDDVRIMSWNNGAMASETRDEFDASVTLAQESYDAVFASRVPGVQPQENMFTPEHIGWYRALGVDWITLFYSATGFTGLRSFVDIEGPALHNPVTLRDGDDTMTWVPVYHHADVLDHGGLAGWVRQLSRTADGDVLLAVHFDGDAESWENFDKELAALQPLLDDGTAVHTTIDAYLQDHEPVTEVEFTGDIADGTGDGFQSWAEKHFNQTVFTEIVRAREWVDRAALLGAPGAEDDLADAIDWSREERLIALSTTHFGLAAPYLAPDRIEAAEEHAEESFDRALATYELAWLSNPVPDGEILLVNPRPSAGPALIEIEELWVPSSAFSGVESVAVYDDGVEVPTRVRLLVDNGENAALRLGFVVDMPAASTKTLTWTLSASGDRATGGLTTADAPTVPALRAPFTRCAGERSLAVKTEEDPAEVDDRGVRVVVDTDWTGPLCDVEVGAGIDLIRWAGLPGTVVQLRAGLQTVEDPDALESVVLTPLFCDGPAETLSWRTFGGEWRTRPVLTGVDAWNGQSIDGSAELACASGTDISVSHRVLERTSMAFLPFADRGWGGDALLAPMGTIYGDDPFHDGRRTGGSGVGEVVTSLVGSQFRPAAPDWSGMDQEYTLLVGEGVDPQVLDLFAHPPEAIVGDPLLIGR